MKKRSVEEVIANLQERRCGEEETTSERNGWMNCNDNVQNNGEKKSQKGRASDGRRVTVR